MSDPNSIFKKGIYREGPSDGLTEQERRWAQSLLKGDNLDRLTKSLKTGRRFRPVPVSIHYEVWWFAGSATAPESWRMARVENGKRTPHGDRWREDCGLYDEIDRLRAAGFAVREIPMDGAPELFPRTRGSSAKRKPFEERYVNFGKVVR